MNEVAAAGSTLPDFLGLGAQRAGTTWLDHVLRCHPEIYLPVRRKEVHYFDQNFHRGTGWYASFFPPPDRAAEYRRIGEITPRYLFEPRAPERIARLLPNCRMIVLLRNPVTRLYSQYGLHVRDLGERRAFGEFASAHPEAFERGLYSRQLSRYFALLERSRFLIVIYEEVMARREEAIDALASFLEVDPAPLHAGAHRGRINAAYVPRLPRLRAAARRFGSSLRARGADHWVNFAKRLGASTLFGRKALPPLALEERLRLERRYAEEVCRLEELLGRSLGAWRSPPGGPEPQGEPLLR